MRSIERLKTVAEVAILSSDAIGKLMEMRLTGDDGAGGTEPRSNGAVHLRDVVVVTIKRRAARCSETRKVEAVFERNRNSPEWLADDIFATKVARLVA